MKLNPVARFLNTSAASTLAGFAIWFILQGLDAVSVFFQASRHMHQKNFHSISLAASPWSIGISYGCAFFLGAAFIARRSRSNWAILAPFVGYLLFLICYLSICDWTRGTPDEVLGVAVPLLTGPLGAVACNRLFPKIDIA